MYDTSVRSNIATVRRALEATSQTFPKRVLKALEEHDKLVAASRAYTPANPTQIADAVAACLLDDRDPAQDETVRSLVISNGIGNNGAMGYGINLTEQANGRVVAALTAEVDAILAMLSGPAEQAGQKLTYAFELIGDENDSASLVRQGGEAVEAWAGAQKAKKLLDLINGAWVALAHLTGFASPTAAPALRLTEADLAVFEKVRQRADAWAIVQAGGTISLANRETFPQRVEQRAEQADQRAAHAGRMDEQQVRRQLSFLG